MYTDRCLEFKTEEGMQKAIATCKNNGIDAIVAIGGDGTFRGATDLTNRGIPTIGVPGTIDNDITATDYTIGFDTAMNTTLHMIDCLADTCESHARLNVVEAMGRGCGDITMLTAIASGAVAAIIPELPFDEETIIARVKRAKEAGKRGMIVVVSEGAFTPEGKPYSEYIAKRIEAETGIETKFARFAHVVRGGTPTLRDRLAAAKMGTKAVELLLEGKSNLIMAEVAGEITPIDINFALITDRMYKGKLKDGDLDKFSAEDVQKMKDICEARKQYLAELEAVLYGIGI
jgi:6-phosphofructokinase 1